jgi:hypothetical protein
MKKKRTNKKRKMEPESREELVQFATQVRNDYKDHNIKFNDDFSNESLDDLLEHNRNRFSFLLNMFKKDDFNELTTEELREMKESYEKQKDHNCFFPVLEHLDRFKDELFDL